MYSQLVKKLPARKEAWLRYGVFLMQVERQEAARALMQRALKCLERRDRTYRTERAARGLSCLGAMSQNVNVWVGYDAQWWIFFHSHLFVFVYSQLVP